MLKSNRTRLIVFAAIAVLLSLFSSLQAQTLDLPLPSTGATSHGRALNSDAASTTGSRTATTRGLDHINDGGLEAGTSINPFWTQTSTNFTFVICAVDNDVCDGTQGNSTVGPRTGEHWAWFGGAYGEPIVGNETGTLSQSLTIRDSATTAQLQFYVWIGEFAAGGSDTLKITMDDTELLSISETNTAYHDGYVLVEIDLSSYTDGVEHTLQFTGTDKASTNTNINLDDIQVLVDGAIATLTATPLEPPTETPVPTETPEPGFELVDNRGFEDRGDNDESLLPPWEIVSPSSDKIKCDKEDKEVSRSGECAFRFKGGVGEASKLRQTVSLGGANFETGGTLVAAVWLDSANTPTLKVKLKVKYSDGTEKGKLTIEPTAATSGYERFNDTFTLASSAVASIRISIDNKATSGKVYVDDVSLRVAEDIVATNTPAATSTVGAATETPGGVTNTPEATSTAGAATETPGSATNTPEATSTTDAATNTPEATSTAGAATSTATTAAATATATTQAATATVTPTPPTATATPGT